MKKELNLGSDKITKLLLSFAIPCVVSMLINSVYNIVDQIFIGKGVGTLGNAATNVIFPLVILCNAISGLIGNGASANLSLKLGEGNVDDAKSSIGASISLTIIVSVIFGILSYLLLPKLVYLFGCTESVYPYAISYGRIICYGIPFMIIYSSLSNIIRADGSPKYSMILLVIGAIINIILDPILIFKFNMGVSGGAIATVVGQVVSFIIAICYIKKFKNFKLTRKDFKINKSILRTLALGVSSFITQLTILVLFVFMNNMMTKFGEATKFGADIPLAVYGVISKVNSLYISAVLGIAIGSQPIIGFNYGAGKYERVKETLKKVLIINFAIGIVFNLLFLIFPTQIVSVFISSNDSTYTLFVEFANLLCRSFLLVIALNALEMTTSNVVQSLGSVVKATAVSFTRQIILFVPIACILAFGFNKGLYGILYAGAIADTICFIICIFVFRSEYKKLGIREEKISTTKEYKNANYKGKKIVITIAREYGSGGRFIGELLAKEFGINFYDKEIISLTAKVSGLSKEYVSKNEQKYHKLNNLKASHMTGLDTDDKIFIAESNVIKKIADNESCVIVGRCGNFVLKDMEDVTNVFIYSTMEDKINRASKYYNIPLKNCEKEINKINKLRKNHYKYYTGRELDDATNYDLCINVSTIGIEKSVELIKNYVINK